MPDLKPAGVYARHTEMFDLVDRQARAERIFSTRGPVSGLVHGRLGYLLFSNAKGNAIFKWSNQSKPRISTSKEPGSKTDAEDEAAAMQGKGMVEVFHEKSRGARGLTLDHQGRLLICESTARRVTRREKDGTVTVLADRYEGQPLVAPGDLIYNIDGSVYFTDIAATSTSGPSSVYQISRTQIPGASRIIRVSQECARPAGVALSPKQDLLYISDATRKNIRVHTINADGTLAPGRVFAEFASREVGEPGGLKTDEKGHVYAAGPGGLWVFSPAGRHLGTVVLPELPTNCNWGAGFSGLYITAGKALYHLTTRVPGTRTF